MPTPTPSTSTFSPILLYQPGGGVAPGSPATTPPVYSQADVTQLVEGQAYIDVVFGTIQVDDDWVLVACEVENTIDFEPLNIWPGIITDRTASGFRLQLNGMPDSSNYYLHWAVSGINIAPIPATLYLFTGPTSGPVDAGTTFTVRLPPSTTLPGLLTVTPDDGGAGGTFSPSSVTLSSVSAVQHFNYTPAGYGAVTISVTNSGTLIDPASITFTPLASTYTLSGPSSGATSTPSTNFTVALPVGGIVAGTVTVTPHDAGGGGTFAPTTVGLTTGAPSATFTYTPATNGTKTISVTNDGGLTNPGSISYVASTPFTPSSIPGLKLWLKADAIAGPPADGAVIPTWADASGNGNDVSAVSGAQPLFKTNRINGLPALKFDGSDDYMTLASLPAGITTAASVFIVQRKNANSASLALHTEITAPTNTFAIYLPYSDGTVYFDLGDSTATGRISAAWGGNFTNFFAWSFVAGGGNMAIYRNGTSVVSSSGHTNSFNPTGLSLAVNGFAPPPVQDADIAEILIYNVALGTTDRQNVENFLRTKYALP